MKNYYETDFSAGVHGISGRNREIFIHVLNTFFLKHQLSGSIILDAGGKETR